MYYVTIHLTIEEFFLLFLLSFQYLPCPIFPCASSVHPPRGPSSIHYSNHRPGKKKAVTLEYLHDKKQARKPKIIFFSFCGSSYYHSLRELFVTRTFSGRRQGLDMFLIVVGG